MEGVPQVFKDGQDALVMAAQLHRVALTKLAKAAGKHIEGLHQGVAVLRGAGLSATTVRKLRELEVIYGFLRHVTEFSCQAFVEQLDCEFERVGKERGAQRPDARVPSVLPQTPPISDRSDGGSESLGSQASADARPGIAIAERLSEGGSANGGGAWGSSAPQPALTTTVTADECASVASGGAGAFGGVCVDVPMFPFVQRDWYIGDSMADPAVQTSSVDQCKGKNKKREGGKRARCGAQQPPASVSPNTPSTPPSPGRDDGDSEPASSEARADARHGVASAERLSGKGGGSGGGASEGSAEQSASPTTTVAADSEQDGGGERGEDEKEEEADFEAVADFSRFFMSMNAKKDFVELGLRLNALSARGVDIRSDKFASWIRHLEAMRGKQTEEVVERVGKGLPTKRRSP